MELKFTLDTDDLYDEDGTDFERLLTDALQKAVIKDCKDRLATDKFKEFSDLAAEAIMTGIKLKMSNFLSEDIALTDKWGKAKFVGSIEDLIKSQFDDVLLRPVDSYGKTIHGCTTSGNTWIEWKIENELKETLDREIRNAKTELQAYIKNLIKSEIEDAKNSAIKKEVDLVVASIIKQKS